MSYKIIMIFNAIINTYIFLFKVQYAVYENKLTLSTECEEQTSVQLVAGICTGVSMLTS